VNLSWNTISDNKTSEKEQIEIVHLIGKAIKHNKQLIHLDLTATGLTTLIVRDLGTILRRAGSLLAIHFSGNPGLSQEIADFLHTRIRQRPREDIEKYLRI